MSLNRVGSPEQRQIENTYKTMKAINDPNVKELTGKVNDDPDCQTVMKTTVVGASAGCCIGGTIGNCPGAFIGGTIGATGGCVFGTSVIAYKKEQYCFAPGSCCGKTIKKVVDIKPPECKVGMTTREYFEEYSKYLEKTRNRNNQDCVLI